MGPPSSLRTRKGSEDRIILPRSIERRDSSCTIKLGSMRIKLSPRIRPQGLALLAAIFYFGFQTLTRVKEVPTMPIAKVQPPPPAAFQLALEKIPSLKYPLEHSQLVALFFSESSAPETRLVRDAFLRETRLLPPPHDFVRREKKRGKPIPEKQQQPKLPLAIVYVPSDDVEGSSEWHYIKTLEERLQLKKLFKTCSNTERDFQELEQKFPTPSLFVVDSVTRGVISTHGLADVEKHGNRALNIWLETQRANRDIDPSVWGAQELFQNDVLQQDSKNAY